MKQVIKEIIDIEHKAKDIISGTNEEIARKRSDAEKKLEALHEKLLRESKEKIEFLRERDTETSVDDVGDDYEANLKKMDDKLDKNLEAWSNHLYELVLGEGNE